MRCCDLANLISKCLTAHQVVHSRRLLELQISKVETNSPIIIITTVLALYGVGYGNIVQLEKCLSFPYYGFVNLIAYLEMGGDGRYIFIYNLMVGRSVRFYDPFHDRDIEMISEEFVKLCSNLLFVTSLFVNVNGIRQINI